MGNLGGPNSIHAVLGLATVEVTLALEALLIAKHVAMTLQPYFTLTLFAMPTMHWMDVAKAEGCAEVP